ncbi:hypothetical protein PMZ80_004264 [Knufia obscura]|uniref:Uncharacterized protein n=1 Tax=Knufia obscura TaxID=1635080 RepID=A0ABR0RRM1_9EURO|nr:hypothetical protein PMZ80_004264 [Knufia obscura]
MQDIKSVNDDAEIFEVEQNQMNTLTWTQEEEKKLVPAVIHGRSPTFLTGDIGDFIANRDKDRTNIGNAKIAGMADDLELSSNQYSVCLVVFFVTYV